MFISFIVGMDGNACISEHGFNTRSGDHNFLIGTVYFVSERDYDAEFHLVGITRNSQCSPSSQFVLVHFNVGYSRL